MRIKKFFENEIPDISGDRTNDIIEDLQQMVSFLNQKISSGVIALNLVAINTKLIAYFLTRKSQMHFIMPNLNLGAHYRVHYSLYR
jgi:hypothetical protein